MIKKRTGNVAEQNGNEFCMWRFTYLGLSLLPLHCPLILDLPLLFLPVLSRSVNKEHYYRRSCVLVIVSYYPSAFSNIYQQMPQEYSQLQMA